MALDFPDSPTLDQTFSVNGSVWRWDGTRWGVEQVSPWRRPADWLALPTLTTGQQKLVGLFAVDQGNSNLVAFTVAGAYTVDWGDGTTEDFASGVTAERNILWENVSSSTLTSNGYRQTIITITPQAGQTLTSIDLDVRHSSSAYRYNVDWLDVAVVGVNLTLMRVGRASRLVTLGSMQQFTLLGPTGITNASNMFANCAALQSVNITDASSITEMNSMFDECRALQVAPDMDTSNVTSMGLMFDECRALTAVPLYDTSNVTRMDSMFINCSALETVPLFDTANVTEMQNMFFNCFSLKTVPLFDMSSVVDCNDMFLECRNLRSVPHFDLSNSANLSQMFLNCERLETIPFFNTSSATNVNLMLQNVRAHYVPQFNFSKVTNATITLFAATNNNVQRSDIIPPTSIDYSGSKFSATELNHIYGRLPTALARTVTNASGNGTTVTYTTSVAHGYIPGMVVTMTGITDAAYNLTSAQIATTPTSTTFTVTNAATGTYTSGGTVTPAALTITVTNCWGAASDDPTIATNKGWTVTG
jgi:surface protein